MRLFIALDLAGDIRERISRFMDGVREFAPDAHWVRPESLHVTLKFIGEQPEAMVEQIKHALSLVSVEAISISFRGFGFFPTARSARVFWVGIAADPQLAGLAKAVDDAIAPLGVAKEERPFSPHLTLARSGRGSGAPGHQKGDRANRDFHRLQEKLAALPVPEFGTMTACEFFLFQSQLLRGGARYTKIAHFPAS